MPNLTGPGLALPSRAQTSGSNSGSPLGFANELVVSEFMSRYYSLSKLGILQIAYALVTAPVIWSTAAGTGGPLLWNPPGSGVDAVILGVGMGSSVVSTVAGSLGLTGNSGQAVAPASTTAIDAVGNPYVGGAPSGVTAYRIGTPTNAGNRYFPITQIHTGALTVDDLDNTWIDLGGFFVIPPGAWGSVAGSATLTTLVLQMGILWAEVPA